MDPNVLYYGDNLDVLRPHVKDESIDLVYLDPPFNSDVNYNVLFAEHGEKSAAQIEAFTDTWEWNTDARLAYEAVVEAGGHVADTMRAFHTMIPGSDMLAYLAMMAPRLVELRRVLRAGWKHLLRCPGLGWRPRSVVRSDTRRHNRPLVVGGVARELTPSGRRSRQNDNAPLGIGP